MVRTSKDTLPLKSHGASRSSFVTVLAWILIAVSAYATFMSSLQAVMLIFFFPSEHFWSNAPAPHGIETSSPFMHFLSSEVRYFFLVFWLLAALALVSSIGLLRRKNWARLIVIGILGLCVIWNLAGIWLQWQFASSSSTRLLLAEAPAEFTRQTETIILAARVSTAIFAVAISGLLVWLITRLVSRPIRREFGAL
jgi:hypothetical protein